MRKGGVLPKTAKDPALHSEIMKRSCAISRKLSLRHSFMHRRPGRAIGDNRKVIRLLHERNFGGRFVHATTRGDRSSADKLQLRRHPADAVVKKEAHPLFNTDSARSDPAVLNDLRHEDIWAFMF